jgi:hypothetical protein
MSNNIEFADAMLFIYGIIYLILVLLSFFSLIGLVMFHIYILLWVIILMRNLR